MLVLTPMILGAGVEVGTGVATADVGMGVGAAVGTGVGVGVMVSAAFLLTPVHPVVHKVTIAKAAINTLFFIIGNITPYISFAQPLTHLTAFCHPFSRLSLFSLEMDGRNVCSIFQFLFTSSAFFQKPVAIPAK